jgi:hypothetical protein
MWRRPAAALVPDTVLRCQWSSCLVGSKRGYRWRWSAYALWLFLGRVGRLGASGRSNKRSSRSSRASELIANRDGCPRPLCARVRQAMRATAIMRALKRAAGQVLLFKSHKNEMSWTSRHGALRNWLRALMTSAACTTKHTLGAAPSRTGTDKQPRTHAQEALAVCVRVTDRHGIAGASQGHRLARVLRSLEQRVVLRQRAAGGARGALHS